MTFEGRNLALSTSVSLASGPGLGTRWSSRMVVLSP